jgi:glycosyltransferase involved in cell wall biosynthesis
LFVDHTAQLGGAELSLLDLAARTPNCRVALFEDGPFVKRLRDEGVDTVVADASALRAVRRNTSLLSGVAAFRGIWQSARAVARLGADCDVLYANSQKGWVGTALASKFCGKPAVWHLRDMLTRQHFSRTNIRVVVGLANRFASSVIANSKATKQAFIDAGGRPDLVRVIYNGIHPGDFSEQHSHGEKPDGHTVACVGRLCQWKGQHVFVDAIAQTSGVRGLVIGEALFGEDDYAEQLREQADRLGITDRIEFMGFRKDVPELLAGCDILAHTAIAPEPFGRVIVEGMFAGAAVIATRGGGPSEIIDHGETGLLIPPGDPAALAATIKHLIHDADDAQRLVAAAAKAASERFSLDTVVRQVHELLNEVARPSIRVKLNPSSATQDTTAS